MANMISIYRIPVILFFFALLIDSQANAETSPSQSSIPPAIEFVPAVEQTQYRVMTFGDGDAGNSRTLAPFQLCGRCKCCPAESGTSKCSTMPCCFVIDCNISGKPYGTCAFVPNKCNCTNCGSA